VKQDSQVVDLQALMLAEVRHAASPRLDRCPAIRRWRLFT
jgi:hypothetical protein